jgi:F0F1-type ATP synthase delta subunit
MANKKTFNSKNLTSQLETLLSLGKADLVVDILKINELKGLLPNILKTLKRKSDKKGDFEQTKIYSKTELDQTLLKQLEESLKVDTKNAKIIIDQNMSAGVKIKSGGQMIDATLETMLTESVEKLLKN